MVKLVSAISSRSGVRAQVTAVTGALRQRRDVDGGSGDFSQPSLPVASGLGSAMTVEFLTICWPSGIVEVLTNLATNQTLTVREHANPVLTVPGAQTVNKGATLTFNVTATEMNERGKMEQASWVALFERDGKWFCALRPRLCCHLLRAIIDRDERTLEDTQLRTPVELKMVSKASSFQLEDDEHRPLTDRLSAMEFLGLCRESGV